MDKIKNKNKSTRFRSRLLGAEGVTASASRPRGADIGPWEVREVERRCSHLGRTFTLIRLE